MAVLLTGCSNLYLESGELLRTENAANINTLPVGMNPATAVELIGQEPAQGVFHWIDNPYRAEFLTGMDGKS